MLVFMTHSVSRWNGYCHIGWKSRSIYYVAWCLKQHCAARWLHQQGRKNTLQTCCFGRVVAPKLGAGVHGPSCVLPHCCPTPVLIAAMPDLAWIRCWTQGHLSKMDVYDRLTTVCVCTTTAHALATKICTLEFHLWISSFWIWPVKACF